MLFFHLLILDIITVAIMFKNVETGGLCFIITGKQQAISLPCLSDWLPTSFWQPIYQFISPTSSQSLLAAEYKIQTQCYTGTRHGDPCNTTTLWAAALQAKLERAPVPGPQPVNSKAAQAEGRQVNKKILF